MRAAPHWIGFGDALSTSANVATSLSAQYGIQIPTDVPSAAQTAYGALPASVQSLVTQGMGTYSDLQPAIALAGQISSGNVNPQMAIGALSAAATVFGGPIAGAVMGTAGEAIQLAGSAMQGLFDALGLYDHPPTVTFVGLTPTTSVPAGPTDPQWIHINTPTDLYNLYNSLSSRDITGIFPPGTWTLYWYFQFALGYLTPNDVECQHGWPGCGSSWTYQPNAFDVYFAHILRADLESWTNGNPYLPPRDLLYSAQTIWNATHSASSTVTYQPADSGSAGVSLVSLLLGSGGDPNAVTTGVSHRAAPVTINLGAMTAASNVIAIRAPLSVLRAAATAPAASSSGPTATTVIAGTAAVAGVGILGTVVFAWATGKTIDAVFGGIWKGIQGALR